MIKIDENLTITIIGEADFVYRSHINGMRTTAPNNWVACKATGSDGKDYTAWYYVTDPDETELDEIEYENPDDITDEYNHIVYEKAE